MQLISAWSKGVPSLLPAVELDYARVHYVVADRAEADIYQHLKRLDVSDSRLDVYSVIDDLTFPIEWFIDGRVAFRRMCERVKPVDGSLLILDTLPPFTSGNLIGYRDVMISLMELQREAKARNITILGVHHAGKSRTDYAFKRAQDRISGSNAFIGYSGTQVVMIEGIESDEVFDTITIVSHNAPREVMRVVRNEDGYFEPWVTEEDDEVAALWEMLPMGSLDTPQIAEFAAKAGYGRSTSFRMIGEMVERRLLERITRGGYKKG
jgi:hypothetical protein